MRFLHSRSYCSAILVILAFFAVAFFTKSCDTPGKDSTPDTTALKIELGRRLFFDKNLSLNGTKSCASCHNPAFAFSDGYRTSTTALGQTLLHNSPSLINTAFNRFYDWADTNVTSYSKQIKRPLYSSHPVELGLNVDLQRNIALLEKNNRYKYLFNRVYPLSDKLLTENMEDAIIAFLRSLVSFNSPYDRFTGGDPSAFTKEMIAGKQLFFSSRLQCGSCHKAPLFTSNDNRYALPYDSIYFNTGLYNITGKGRYPAGDEGLFGHTGRESDIGRFKVPSLRNIALTAPYLHDGSAATLQEVVDIYSRGGRKISAGPMSGDGKENPYKDQRIRGFSITAEEKRSLIAFLCSLTDSSVLTQPRFMPLPGN